MPEGERAQEGPQGGGRHDPMAEHLAGSATAQQVGVVDAVPTRQHRVDQGQQLAARMCRAGPLAQVDQRIGGLLDAQPLGQRSRQQQARVCDGVGVVEADVELVQDVGGSHRESALLVGDTAAVAGAILPGQRAFLIIGSAPFPLLERCTQAQLKHTSAADDRAESSRHDHRVAPQAPRGVAGCVGATRLGGVGTARPAQGRGPGGVARAPVRVAACHTIVVLDAG